MPSRNYATKPTVGDIEAEVTRAMFETWIADDLARIEATMEAALSASGVGSADIDRVFLTGGSSLIPAVRHRYIVGT